MWRPRIRSITVKGKVYRLGRPRVAVVPMEGGGKRAWVQRIRGTTCESAVLLEVLGALPDDAHRDRVYASDTELNIEGAIASGEQL